MESTSSPSGSIQKPRIGRKPSKPPKQRATPSAIRIGLDEGMGNEKRPKFSRLLRADDAGSALFNLLTRECEFDIAIRVPLR